MKPIYTLTLAAAFLPGISASAQSTTPDLLFGTGGKVVTPIGTNYDRSFDVAVQADGKIIATGYTDGGPDLIDFALTRYNSDGSLDATFGAGGKVTTDLGMSAEDVGWGMALQPDGKILMTGYTSISANLNVALVRYNSNGTLDASFGTGGIVIADLGNYDYGYSVAVQTDGKIVVGGMSSSTTTGNFAVMRFNANGTLDNTFGTSGFVVSPIGTDDDYGMAVVIQNDGKIVLGGWADPSATSFDFGIVRYNTDGTLDTGFDTDGIVFTDFGGQDQAYALGIQADGKIVAAGYSNVGGPAYSFAVSRYNTDGSPDASFGTGGQVLTSMSATNNFRLDLLLLPDGKIAVAGCSAVGGNADFAMARYNANGSPDLSLDTDGIVATDFGASDDIAYAAAIQSDGKIVLSGSSHNGTNDDFGLVRYFVCNTVVTTISDTISDGDSLVVGTSVYTTSGTYVDSLLTLNNCDSIIITNLTVLTGVESFAVSAKVFSVFPNPSTGKVSVTSSDKSEYTINLYDVRGEIASYSVQRLQGFQKEIDLSGLSPGNYFLHLESGNHSQVIKLLLLSGGER